MARNAELAELAESIFAASYDKGATGLDTAAWKACAESGLTTLTDPEVGGTLEDSAVLLEAAGAWAARVPLAETDLLGGWLARAADLAAPDGPSVAVTGSAAAGAGDTVSVELARVPWGRALVAVVLLDGDRVLVLDTADAAVTEGANIAEEPRDTLTFTGVTPVASGAAPAGAAEELALRAALARSLLLAGAARGALARSIGYAGERQQFGRPIARFQAVQQMLAEAGSEVAAAAASSAAAARTARTAGFADPATVFAVAAAKSRCGEAATAVARIAHQVHGAIGFTREHDLRLVSTRLWAWRDEDGNEAYWNDRVGELALRAGADGLWPLVTGRP
ncbi:MULTISPECIES: acyl-CoA dehydrogenase family protein [Pseudonocardia]|uniref:Acryloyl-CoA reductase (NADH) n=2 Tax=Pseudonocardia TaxID=1847 RepID=A0A1Y2N2S1_PSEAH|nr:MULTISPECIES: acyl-CoA dehydrogenase family protein [Pseudonocardia]OSY41469.1 Acryloyl-CoA reductase (NADH) [Pseudonocardia autotrophica]TDN71426.1 acyl-CoA dehydrogenase [Pseudonocardia autotrophica]BBG02101.1 acyl-CoA dehydrogenase [Pseudonocardia autotrophica]GEC24115.1 acyl-CoA dehydrogenase [Pseudonocardia saturnea]